MLTESKMLEVFRQAPIFSLLSPHSAGLGLLCRNTREIHYPEGAVLFFEGDKGDSLYLLVSGKVRLLKDGTPLFSMSKVGTPIGEMALVVDDTRSATVEVLEPSCFLEIRQEHFFQALALDPSITRGVYSALSHKLREALQNEMQLERREIARKESMRLVAEVQRSLLPAEEIWVPGLCTAGYCRAADAVGGDYYDYRALADGRYAVFMADVMGHGLHSAMLMAMVKSGLHIEIQHGASVDSLFKALQGIADEQVGIFIYLTCCYLVFEPRSGRLEYANAGHPPMLLHRAENGEILELSSSFPPLGLLPIQDDTSYTGKVIDWRAGDVLVIYSDGITESSNAQGEIYGLERLRACLRNTANLSAAQVLQRILDDQQAFIGEVAPRDDLTLVVIRADQSDPSAVAG